MKAANAAQRPSGGAPASRSIALIVSRAARTSSCAAPIAPSASIEADAWQSAQPRTT